MQIFRTSIGLSGTQKEVSLYGGSDLPYQRAKKGTEHALDKLMSTLLEIVL